MEKNDVSKIKYLVILLVGAILSFSTFFGVRVAFADQPIELSLSLENPSTKMEYKELVSPIDSYLWGENSAIIQEDNSLLVFYNGEYYSKSFTSPKQVKKLDSQSIVISDNGTLYKQNFTNGLTESAETLVDSDSQTIGVNSFDINDSFLITAFSGIRVYSIANNVFTRIETIPNDRDTPVHISSSNEIFYVKDSVLFKHTLSDSSTVEIASTQPSAMVTVGEHLYYSVVDAQSSTIYRVSTSGGESVEMTITDEGFDLGVLKQVSDICVKDGKLIITDKTIGAVQEFEIDNNNNAIIFTGFAIAKNKSAFNRIGSTAFDVESLGNTKAVIDNKKITLICKDDFGVRYTNFKIEDMGGFIPTNICLGKESLLLKGDSSLKLLKLSKTASDISDVTFDFERIVDLCYQNGNFYVSALDVDNKAYVYSLNEKSGEIKTILSLVDVGTSPLITVDCFGNIYLATGTGVTLFYPDGNNYSQKTLNYLELSLIKKIAVDLVGNLFILTDGSFVKYDGESVTEFNLSSDVISGNICSFALNAVSDKVTFIASGEEVILGTDKLLNFSFEDFSSQVLFEQNEYIKNLSAINSSTPSTAFVTTTVNLYYLPVITESDDFAIEDVNNSLLKLRNGQAISPLYKINFYGVDFYLADITVNENTIKGYIPVNFTTKVLSDDVISTTFTMEKVSETTVFADFELTSEVKKLSENEEVKVFEIKQGVATIGYLVDGEYVLGYISEDAIIKAPDTVIKNVVMVVALALCLVVTSLYFINKKKD